MTLAVGAEVVSSPAGSFCHVVADKVLSRKDLHDAEYLSRNCRDLKGVPGGEMAAHWRVTTRVNQSVSYAMAWLYPDWGSPPSSNMMKERVETWERLLFLKIPLSIISR